MHQLVRSCLAILVCAALTNAQTPLKDKLTSIGYTDARQLALYAQSGLEQIAPNVTLTALAPTNEAIQKFLRQMNLTMEEMRSRPFLAAAIVGYHIIPGVKISTEDVKGATKDNPIFARTADLNYPLRFFLDKDGKTMLVEDVHGNTAKVVKPNVAVGRSMLQGIDRVLQSGDVYTSVEQFLLRHPEFESMKAEVTKLGAYDQLRQSGQQLTVFAPTDDAFKAAGTRYSSLPSKEKKDLLFYHMLPNPRALPAQLEDGKSYATLFKGHELKIDYDKVALPAAARLGSKKSTAAEATNYGANVYAIPETFKAGSTRPRVVLANIFANKVVIHGIDQVLFPDFKSAGSATAKEGAHAHSAGRKLLAFVESLAHMHRRKLQQSGLLGRRYTGATLNSLAATSTQASIRQAAEGRTAASDATSSGMWNAQSAASRCFNCVVEDWFGKK